MNGGLLMKIRDLSDNKRGISLISLIITIIVIIILAAIVIFTGLNTPDRANLAKFMQEFSDFRTAITQDFMNKKTEYALSGKSRSNAQIYYAIATGEDYKEDINKAPTAAGTVGSLGITVFPEALTGTDFYEIKDDAYVAEWKNNKAYYEARGVSGERHFLTDEGEPFILPGYLVREDSQNKWYVNERKYYVSKEPIHVTSNSGSQNGLDEQETISFYIDNYSYTEPLTAKKGQTWIEWAIETKDDESAFVYCDWNNDSLQKCIINNYGSGWDYPIEFNDGVYEYHFYGPDGVVSNCDTICEGRTIL